MEKLWLKLPEVFKIFKTNYKEIIQLVSLGKIKVSIVGGENYFNAENLKEFLEIKIKQKDVYSIENDFTNRFENFENVQHKQVIYSDNRLFQSFVLEWRHFGYREVREVIKSIKKDDEIMGLLSKVQPFSSYGFTSNKLAITLKKGLQFSSYGAEKFLNKMINSHFKHKTS